MGEYLSYKDVSHPKWSDFKINKMKKKVFIIGTFFYVAFKVNVPI